MVSTHALNHNIDGGNNTATGAYALFNNTASDNTAVGFNALGFNTGGVDNTATGVQALYGNTVGGDNTADGSHALSHNDTGTRNTATGFHALDFNTNGNRNTAAGDIALFDNTTGSNNTAVGDSALQNNTVGSNNVALGFLAGSGVTTVDNVIAIGAAAENVGGTCYIGNIYGQHSSSGLPVIVNPAGKLGTDTSSRRFKREIQPIGHVSEVLYALKPVSFRYKKEIDPAGARQLGLVAEDVQNVNADLIVRDREGKPYGVRYDQVNAMLLNEFLKEHKKVQQLEISLAKQQKDFRVAIAELKKETDAKIQKVTAQIELNKTPSRMIVQH